MPQVAITHGHLDKTLPINGGQDALSIGYTELIAPMIRAIQEQQAMIEVLQAQVEALAP